MTGIAAHADASEVGMGHIVVTSGRRWFLCCNLAGGRLGEPAKGYGEQGLPDILWRTCPQRSCPRNNTWHRPKLSTAVRDRSVRTQCTSLSHGGARAPEKMYRPLSEDMRKTASTIILVRSKAATSITIPYIVVHTPDLRSPSPVRVRGCRLVVARLRVVTRPRAPCNGHPSPLPGVAWRSAPLNVQTC